MRRVIERLSIRSRLFFFFSLKDVPDWLRSHGHVFFSLDKEENAYIYMGHDFLNGGCIIRRLNARILRYDSMQRGVCVCVCWPLTAAEEGEADNSTETLN